MEAAFPPTARGHGLVRLVREAREVRPKPIVSALVVDLATGAYEAKPLA